MIRKLEKPDYPAAIRIVNENWKREYAPYLNPQLLTEEACNARAERLEGEFDSGRLMEYVWEEDGKVLALLSIGPSADEDKTGAFELWRIYIDPDAQGRGIGRQLMAFAEREAVALGYREMVIWAFRENRRAVAFYRKHGYAPDKEMDMGAPYKTWGIRLTKKL